jgi:hypothetical protein
MCITCKGVGWSQAQCPYCKPKGVCCAQEQRGLCVYLQDSPQLHVTLVACNNTPHVRQHTPTAQLACFLAVLRDMHVLLHLSAAAAVGVV